MKTCLHRLLPTAILSLSSLAQPLIAQTMYDKSQYVDQVDVKISQPYTPFGNRPEFNRYGDDGSKCVLDANGVLTWTGNNGEVRLLPDSSKAVPLFVTNTECLVWVNRFVDYNTYPDRPDAQLRLYRSTPESNEVTSQDVSFQGKEIIATPQVTTTTGTLTFVSATRKDNADETPVTGGTENNSDDCELRFYRLTFDAGVQFVGAKTLPIRAVPDFEINTAGPDASSIGYGSDGSLAIQIPQVQTNPKLIPAEYELKQTYWIDSQGRFLQVQVDDNATTGYQPQDGSAIIGTTTTTGFDIDRALFVSNTRLLFEHSGSSQGIQEHRRSSSTGNLLTSSIKDLTTSVEGTTLDIWNYSQVGVNRYFYTVSTDVGSAFSVSGTLTDGATPAVNVTFPDLSYAGVKNGKAHYTSDATQVAKALWYEAVWESNRWNLKYYTAATSASSEWRSSSAVAYPDLATGWTAVPITIGAATRTPTGTPTVSRKSGEVASKIVRTYKLNSTGISKEKETTLTGTLEVSPAAMTGTVNTNDGSALLVTEDGDALIWLHSAAPGYTALPTSDKASALFVTNDQAVIWENAKAPVGGNGQIPNAIVKHYKQVGTVATTIRTDGNKTLLNTSRLTPDPEYWFFTTAIKTDASTSRLTTYKLGTVEIANVDTDNDGLLDYYETNTGTFVSATNTGTDPSKADSDSDGLNDGSEVTNYKTNPTDDDSDNDTLKDGAEVLTYFTNPLLADTDGDSLSDSAELNIHNTDPLKKDTDGDALEDDDEISRGTDPRDTDSDNDNLTDGDEVARGTDPKLKDSDGDTLDDDKEVLVHLTDPNDTDTDGDLLDDAEEVSKGTDPNNDQDPKVIDTDKDGLTNFDEIYVHNTDPKKADTDGDGINDGAEITAGTDPLDAKADTDGDGFTDAEELASVPPTDPKDPASKPVSLTYGDPYNVPNLRNDPVSVSVTSSFAPFGQRPKTDKTSEDGSVALRDENGVIIWANNRGAAVPVPNSSLAKTLYLSNTECVVWQNRFESSFNAVGSSSQIVVHRRDADGKVTSSPLITLNGTILETSPVSPSTYGFTLAVASRFDNGRESRQRYESGFTLGGPTYAIRDVDVWDGQSLTIYRITWDDKLQVLSNITQDVPKTGGNLGAIQVLGNGSDGSFFFKSTIARDFYDDIVPVGVGDTAGEFRTQTANFWVTTTQDKERIFTLGEWTKPSISAPYVTNNRIILETQVVDPKTELPTGGVQLRDVRIQTNGSLSEAEPQNLDAGDNVLPVSDYTRAGLPAFIYTIDAANTGIKLYEMESQLKRLGVRVTLPAPIVRGNAYVRDPRDASLLIKTEGAGLVWIPASKNWQTGELIGLGRLRTLPNSSKAMPLFVSSTEAIAWMNASAPVDIASGGVVPNAQLSHFAISTENEFVTTNLAPPIAGRHVALTPSLSPDAKTEGWYISTFTKASARSAVMRTYKLNTESLSDADRDGLADLYETKTGTFVSKTNTGTLPTSIDSDGDSLLDGEEVYPFAIIRGTFNWQQARDDAKNRGGRLAVIPNDSTYQSLKSLLGGKLVDLAWVGASDQDLENVWDWHMEWKFPQSISTPNKTSVQSNLSWETGKPDNMDESDAMLINPNFYFEDAQLTRILRYYIIEYRASDPTKSDSDGDKLSDFEERVARSYANRKDSDSDKLDDFVEWKTTKTYPLVADSDGDGLDDGTENNGWPVGSKTYTSDPLLIDTDNDGFDDKAEYGNVPPTNPRDNQDKPKAIDPSSKEEKALNKQVRLEDPPSDLTIGQPFAPFGNRTDLNRYGDDGSAMMVDVNGVLIWRDVNGDNRQIPDSELHIPLVVSNSEAIVWTNGFKSYFDYSSKEMVKAVIYRADPVTGAILAPVSITLEGKEILPTAPITTTSQAYHIVTSDHDYGIGEMIFRIYRVTFSGAVQLLGQIRMDRDLPPENSLALTKVLGHGSDGSIVFAQDSYEQGPTYERPAVVDGVTLIGKTIVYKRKVFWVDGVRPTTVGAGIWETLYEGIERRNENDPFPEFDFERVVSTSRTQVVYEKLNASGVAEIFEARRNMFTGLMISKDMKVSGVSDLGRILQISTQTLEGDTRWFYAINKTNTAIFVCRLTNTGIVLDYEAEIPAGAFVDETATVANINRVDGSAVIVSDNVPVIMWLHNSGSSVDKNIHVIPNVGAAVAKPLFVTKDELVLWNNDGAPVLPNGSLPQAMVTHYWLNPAKSELVATSLSAKIDGTYVMSSPPFTSAPETNIIPGLYEWPWLFTTVEKTGSATVRLRTYRLQNWNIFDEDNDGFGSAEEEKWKTNPQDPDTDRDGIPDGLEVQSYRIVIGNYSFEEARLDAILKGGWLARPNTKAKLQAMVRQLRGLNTGRRLWIGGGDMDAPNGKGNLYEDKYQWLDNEGKFFNTQGSPVGAPFAFTYWGKGQPSNVGNLDGLQLEADFTWSMASLSQKQGYVLESKPTDPLTPDGDADRDGDGLSDRDEIALGADPYKVDTDNDGLSDFTEAGVLFSNPLTGFLSGAPVTIAASSFEGLLYSEQNGLLGKISVDLAKNGSFTGTYEIYNGPQSAIKGTLSKNDGLLIANSFESNPKIGATTIVLQKDSATNRNHLHVRVKDSKLGNVYAKARPAAIDYKPLSSRFTLEAALSEDASGPTGPIVATGSIAKSGGVSLQIRNPDGTTASSSGNVLDGGVLALYAKSSGSAPSFVMSNIKINNVLKTNSNFDGQARLLADEYDQVRILEGSFYTPPAPRSLPIATLNASNTANNAVFNWTGGELDKAYQVNSWHPSEIIPSKTNYDQTVATFTSATGLMKVDYTRSDKDRNLYQVKSTAYAVVNQRKNTVNGFYSRLNWEGGSFSIAPNSQKLAVPLVTPPPAPIEIPGSVTSISPASKSVGNGAATYNIKVTGVDNWKVSIDESPSWVSAEVVNDDKSQWADELTGRDNATVKITVDANNAIETRTATINIGNKVHTLTQSAGKVTSINPKSKQAVAEENTYSIRVLATGSWKAVVPTPAWIKAEVVNDNGFVPSGTGTGTGTGTGGGTATSTNLVGQGNATINVTISPNETEAIRSGSILIGDKVHSISQRPAFLPGAVTSINPTSKDVTAIASTYSIRVTGKDNWRVALNGVRWLQAEVINDDGYVAAGNLTGSGNATIKVNVAANSTTTRRTGTIKVGDKVHTVVQAPIIESGSVSSISPTDKEVGKEGATYNIRVTGTKNWSISIPSGSSWLSAKVVNDNGFVYAAAPNVTGSGNATVQVTVAGNATNRRRSASINIGGKTHTCEQSYRSIR
jgi:hypothetical protein